MDILHQKTIHMVNNTWDHALYGAWSYYKYEKYFL